MLLANDILYVSEYKKLQLIVQIIIFLSLSEIYLTSVKIIIYLK